MRIWIGIALIGACIPVASSPGGPALPGAPASPPPRGPDAPAAQGQDAPPGMTDEPDAPDPGLTGAPPGPLIEPAAAGQAARSDPTGWVDAHNRYRAKHCAAALTWSPRLAEVAQRWANALRDRGCQFGHSGGNYGENLAAGTKGTLDPASVVKMWYDEIAQYRFPDGGFSMETGHFTQVVWRGTRQVGCGHSQCKGMDIYVCEYDPPGNWEGQYRDNVRPRGCR
jgi:uncharacterized protein YkwD